jgi:hypothetical protein
MSTGFAFSIVKYVPFGVSWVLAVIAQHEAGL